MSLTISTCDNSSQASLIREFLLRSHEMLNSLHNWDPRRWDGYLFDRDNAALADVNKRMGREVPMVFRKGKLVGFAVPEYPGGVHVQVIPDDAPVQVALIEWAEEHLRQPKEGGGSWLEVHCLDSDLIRKQILRGRGFAPLEEFERIYTRTLRDRVPRFALPAGYAFANARRRDGEAMAELFNAAFGRTTHSAQQWSNFTSLAPSYRSDMQIVATAPDGSIASNAGFAVYMDQSFAVVEPVCTHPAHANRGLAKAVLSEGMRRAAELGIHSVYVGAWHSNPVSNHVYQTLGFGEPRRLRIWRREYAD